MCDPQHECRDCGTQFAGKNELGRHGEAVSLGAEGVASDACQDKASKTPCTKYAVAIPTHIDTTSQRIEGLTPPSLPARAKSWPQYPRDYLRAEDPLPWWLDPRRLGKVRCSGCVPNAPWHLLQSMDVSDATTQAVHSTENDFVVMCIRAILEEHFRDHLRCVDHFAPP